MGRRFWVAFVVAMGLVGSIPGRGRRQGSCEGQEPGGREDRVRGTRRVPGDGPSRRALQPDRPEADRFRQPDQRLRVGARPVQVVRDRERPARAVGRVPGRVQSRAMVWPRHRAGAEVARVHDDGVVGRHEGGGPRQGRARSQEQERARRGERKEDARRCVGALAATRAARQLGPGVPPVAAQGAGRRQGGRHRRRLVQRAAGDRRRAPDLVGQAADPARR